ncbi:FliG C-terminal domain-containing protein [Loktanella sp. S4079]|uniref:FliG C-terminal domain-containing protein n=1 Tax=Loktanella sp. S4079 TaxID=579483 RepID=UPI0005FA1E4D|nr:FliG C-terminal domain-containing protein [Loktanella sp. S4079]KJZ20358.1 flagellar motor switch protein FliG [Loktanella sp. S4079]
MNVQNTIPLGSSLSRRRKAAMIVHLMIHEGSNLSLSELPESLQELLTDELGSIRLVDRQTVTDVAEEFLSRLEAVGLSAPGTRDGAIAALSDHLSPTVAGRLRAQMTSVKDGDHWHVVAALPNTQIVKIMNAESVEVCAVALSKLPTAKAAEVLAQTPGERARRITYAMSLTSDVKPDAVHRIGQALAKDYGQPTQVAFDKGAAQRLGAILNAAVTETREEVLDDLTSQDPVFASDLRKAIFTFKDIPHRIAPTDVPNCIRSVDGETLSRAIAAALADDADMSAAAEFILSNVSQRMAGQIREDAQELGTVKKSDAEKAMSAVTAAIRELVEAGAITLREPEGETDG